MKKVFLLILTGLLLFAFNLKAQEIEANVTVNIDQLTQENRINVSSMESDVERYINSQEFTEMDWEGEKIPVDITIVLTGGTNNVYSARMFIASNRYIYGQDGGTSVALKMVENNWGFEYQRGAMFSFNLYRYDHFSSMIDFYMLLVIGFDLDSYTPLDGTDVFERAKKIAQVAANKNIAGYEKFANPGEFTKIGLLNELTDPRYEPFRKLISDYYYDGLDMMAEDRELAINTLAYLIQEMADFKKNKLMGPSLLLQVFFDTKYNELGQLFKEYKDKDFILSQLTYLDPTHTQKYQEALEE